MFDADVGSGRSATTPFRRDTAFCRLTRFSRQKSEVILLHRFARRGGGDDVSRGVSCRLLHFWRQMLAVEPEVLWRTAVASVALISLSRQTRQPRRQLSRRLDWRYRSV